VPRRPRRTPGRRDRPRRPRPRSVSEGAGRLAVAGTVKQGSAATFVPAWRSSGPRAGRDHEVADSVLHEGRTLGMFQIAPGSSRYPVKGGGRFRRRRASARPATDGEALTVRAPSGRQPREPRAFWRFRPGQVLRYQSVGQGDGVAARAAVRDVTRTSSPRGDAFFGVLPKTSSTGRRRRRGVEELVPPSRDGSGARSSPRGLVGNSPSGT